jgi:mono/diheme cytochrome c family protein
MSCHTAPNGKPFAGGLSMDTPFGPLITPNITPDRETGIGAWSDDDFYRVMHEGIGKDGEYLYPVMPFPWYTIVTREDVLAIKAYLFTQAPQHNPRPPNTLRFPFNVRTSLLAWREAFFKPGDFVPDPKQSETVNRGAYLVNGLAHCGECHNARPVAGTSRWRESLAGGIVQNWYAPNISSDVRSGIGAWSNKDLVAFLKTGMAPGKGIAVGPMAEAIHSLSHLTDADLNAIAAYLKTTPAESSAKPVPATPQAFERGAQTYLNYCASCHGVHGEGQGKAIPALKANAVVLTQGPQNAISVVLGGLEARDTYAPMLAIGASMSDDEVADVVNYVRQSWGNSASATATSSMVATLRAQADTLYTANPLTACPAIADTALAKSLGSASVQQQLRALTQANMYATTQKLVQSARAQAPGVGQAALVNGFAAAYCPLVRQDSKLDQTGKSLAMGRFVESIYIAANTTPR